MNTYAPSDWINRIARNATCIGTLFALAATAQASSRRFAYNYETTTMPPGQIELENSVTWETGPRSDPDFERFDIRHEFEFGVTDRLQLSFYFLDWRYEKTSQKSGNSAFQDVAVEAIYNLTNPNTEAYGSALYGEMKGGGDYTALEAKLLLQKNLGPLVLVYNIGGEVAWESHYENSTGELSQTLGIAYQISPTWSLGGEMLNEIDITEAEHTVNSGVYLGPNASWRKDRFTITTAAMWQFTQLSNEPDFQLRTLFSVAF